MLITHKQISLLMILVSFTTCSNALSYIPSIINKPILFDAKRIALTREYRLHHYGIKSQSITIIPVMIVLHWTETNTLKEAFNHFYPSTTDRNELNRYGQLNVSAHFLVDRDGTIYQLMPDNVMARHVIGLNNIAIGIENVGGFNSKANLTQAQVDADTNLIFYLTKKYPSIRYLIGHYEYLKFKNTPLWQEKYPNFVTFKKDPGPQFMEDVRTKLKTNFHLMLKSSKQLEQ